MGIYGQRDDVSKSRRTLRYNKDRQYVAWKTVYVNFYLNST